MTQELTEKNTYKDNEGRVIFVEKKDFWKYVESRHLSQKDVLNLSPDNKLKFFLKWKHGFTDSRINEEIEFTKESLSFRDKHVPLDQIDPSMRQWIKNEREFNSYCQSIKSQIGLSAPPQEVQDAAKQYGGIVVGYKD